MRALKRLARVLTVLTRSGPAQVDADSTGGLRMTGPGQGRSGGGTAGVALELEQ
ncbi:hypothetical protein [Streptomyces sp. NTH33]|uniref:hypothetical protein n=1 Tax=Streptomyces sp. NTH33 TaxID=1735453 RepID=UPI0015E885B3|nr:hypothetical protein [Streptomyces sp. NTH33]